MTAASETGMSKELTQHHRMLCDLNRDVGSLEGKVRWLFFLVGVSIFMCLVLTYANFCAIQDIQDQSHIHPR